VAVNGVLFPRGSQNKTQVVARDLTKGGLKGGKGGSRVSRRRDPQLPSINVPGNGHSVSTELKMTQKTQLVDVLSERSERVNGHL
jgi:hypothetical protein